MSTTAKRPSLFSRFSSSASIRSNSSTSSTEPSIPKSKSDYNRYAKDGKGYDFNLSYPYSTTTSSASSTMSSSKPSSFSEDAQDFKLRYAKDGKGHDFASTYVHAPSNASMSLGMGGMGDVWIVSSTPRGSASRKSKSKTGEKNMRYAWHAGRQGS